MLTDVGIVTTSYISFNGGYKMNLHPGNYKLAIISSCTNENPNIDSMAVTYYEHGNAFNDSLTKLIIINPKSDIELNNFKMEKASGSISGTFYNCNAEVSNDLGGYILVAFDEFGYMSKLLTYSNYNNRLDGNYKICGLRPGKYYVLAIIIKNINLCYKWYDGIDKAYSLIDITFKMDIPENITPITVGENETKGINFYINSVTLYKDIKLVSEYKLEQNYPNPFNPSTVISYQLAAFSHATLKVYDVLGNEVATLVNEEKPAGNYEVTWNADNFPSGVYFYQLKADNFTATKKLLLLK
ncbi:MAG: T9SS type A sorting domain-containing protein [Ignavibacteriaceae bacterium]